MRLPRFLPTLLLALLSPLPAAIGQITFTAVSVLDNFGQSNMGYTQGTSYTFVFTTGSAFGNTSSSFFTGSMNFWSENYSADDQLWSDVSGTGLGGAFVSPADDPSSTIYLTSSAGLQLSAADEGAGHSLGLTTPLGGYGLVGISINAYSLTSGFTFPGYYTDPVTYFSAATDTYLVDSVYNPTSSNRIRISFSEGGSLDFRLVSVTIATAPAAVPESATNAVFVGVISLVLAVRLRSRFRTAR